MPEISQFYRQQKLAALSGVGTLTASDIAAATAGQRELIRAGQMLTNFGLEFLQQKERAEFHDQLNTARTGYLTRFFEYEQGLQSNADTKTYLPGLETMQSEAAEAYEFTHKGAENKFHLWRANENLSQTKRVSNFKHGRDIQNYTDNWNLNIQEATRRTSSAVTESDYQLGLADGRDFFGVELVTEAGPNGEPVPKLDKDGEPILQLIEDWENTLLDTDEERMGGYREWKADVDVKREKFIAEQLITALEVQAFEIADTEGFPAAEEFLSDPGLMKRLIEGGLERKDARSLLNDVIKRVKRQQAQKQEELENKRTSDRSEIVNAMRGDDLKLVSDLVAASDLSPEEQFAWDEKINARSEAIIRGKDNPMNQTVPAKYFDLRRKIEDPTQAVTEDELAAAVGKGISIDDYETLLTMITDKNDPLNAPQAKRGQEVIARLRGLMLQLAKEDEDLDPREIELNVLAVQNEFDRWLKENTTATDADIEKKVQSLTRPAVVEVTLGFFGRLGTGLFRGGRGKFDIALTEKRMETLQEQTIFNAFNPSEQQQAIDLVQGGTSVEDAIRQVESGEIARETLPTVSTKEERDRLPSGTRYRDPAGNIAVKQ